MCEMIVWPSGTFGESSENRQESRHYAALTREIPYLHAPMYYLLLFLFVKNLDGLHLSSIY